MKESTKNLYLERMNAVLMHIQQHLDDEMDLESLAEMSFFSPVHFHRIFKGMMGETVVEHIRRIRLERAANRLTMGTSTVTDAAFDAGYESVEAFSRKFKKMFGCPPSKFQEKHWELLYEKDPGAIRYLPDSILEELAIQPQEETTMEVTVRTIDPMRVAFVRHTGPYLECDSAWETLVRWADRIGALSMSTQFIGISYDDPNVTPSDKLRYDACITIADGIEGEGEVGVQDIPGGEYATYLHIGPYEKLEQAYADFLGKWLPQSGREPGESFFEKYLNDPQTTPPEKLQTEIYIALK